MKKSDSPPKTSYTHGYGLAQRRSVSRIVRCFLCAGLLTLGLLSVPGQAQELSAADSAEIQRKAIRHVRQFEGLLNLVAQPDKYFRKYSFTKLIRSFYDEQSDYQIFRDSLVAIEDDINPRARPSDNNFLTIKDYLKAFFSFYEKSPVASVFFSEYQASAVKQAEFTYVEVFYYSEFTNRHRAYSEHPYPLRRQKATLRAQRQEGEWQVLVSNVNFSQPGEELVASLTDGPSSLAEPTYRPAQVSSEADAEAEPLETPSNPLADSTRIGQALEKLARDRDDPLRRYDPTSALKEVVYLPLVKVPTTTGSSEAIPQNKTELFRKFTPLIKRAGPSSVQVVLDNPVDDSLTVALMDMNRRILFSEKVAGQQHYARFIELKDLDAGRYQVSVANGDYDHTVRIDYQLPKPGTTTEETEEVVFSDFKPYIMKKTDQPSVQVVFKNPADTPIAVALTDTRGRVLYSETVGGQQSYARSISLRSLSPGTYRIKIAHDRYQRTVRVDH